MLSTFGLDVDSYEFLHQTNKEILEKFVTKNSSVSISNRLFVNDGEKIMDSFLDKLDSVYKSACTTVPFALDTSRAISEINSWVKESTNNKITKLVDEIRPNTALLVANAVHFKSFWALRFSPENTQIADFTLINGDKIKVNMMYQSKKFKLCYLEDINCDVIELAYSDEKLKMLVFLPRNYDGISKVESEFSYSLVIKALDKMHMRKVDLWLPSFKLEESYKLGPILQKLGMRDAFNAELADFSKINGNRNLFISSVIHKTFVQVNEEGTEAAAVTGVVLVKRSIEFPESFRADHPFLFTILETEKNSVLFLGCLKQPAESSKLDSHDEL